MTCNLNSGGSSGSFKLSFRSQTSAAIAYDATAVEVKDALELLPSIGTVDVSFEEAVTGTKRRIDFQPGKAVDVTIPAGVEDGQVLRLKGLGHPGAYGGPAGAGLVEVKIRPHPFFRREGDDIRVDLPITLKEALQGGKVRAPTVEGPVEVRVPEGTSSGALLRLRGKGVPKPDGTRGDQIVRLMIDIPVNDPQLDSFVETWTPPADYDPRKRFRRSS